MGRWACEGERKRFFRDLAISQQFFGLLRYIYGRLSPLVSIILTKFSHICPIMAVLSFLSREFIKENPILFLISYIEAIILKTIIVNTSK